MKKGMAELAEKTARYELNRLVADEPNRLAAYALETDIIERLRRVFYFAKRVAKCVIAAPLSDRESA